MSETPREKLERRLVRVGDCLEWQGGKSGNGYGQISVGGHTIGTHRLAWVLANKSAIPDGLYVLHSCDNKICCEPTHLHLGTQLDNMREMRDRGRSRTIPLDQPLPPSPGMARLIATYNQNKARRQAREEIENAQHKFHANYRTDPQPYQNGHAPPGVVVPETG